MTSFDVIMCQNFTKILNQSMGARMTRENKEDEQRERERTEKHFRDKDK